MTHGRFLVLLGASAAACFVMGAPASAATLTLVTPQPAAISITPANDGLSLALTLPAQASPAPDSAAIDVQAGPATGLAASTSNGLTGPISVKVAPDQSLAAVPTGAVAISAGPTSSRPVTSSAPPTNVASTPAPLPADAPLPSTAPPAAHADPINPGIATGRGARAHSAPVSPTQGARAGISPATRRFSPIARFTPVSASITAPSRSGFLSALPEVGARVMLWVALVGLAFVIQMFVSSGIAARRRRVRAEISQAVGAIPGA